MVTLTKQTCCAFQFDYFSCKDNLPETLMNFFSNYAGRKVPDMLSVYFSSSASCLVCLNKTSVLQVEEV